MHKTLILLFAIPIISFIVIGLYQVIEETFKKEFIVERRGTGSGDGATDELKRTYLRRRYSDAAAAQALGKPENAESEVAENAPVAQAHGA